MSLALKNGKMSLDSEASTKASLNSFSIPRSSFTAFRLLFASAHECGEMAKVVYMGAIPKAWYGGKKYGLVATTVKRAKRKIRRRTRKSDGLIDRSVRKTVTLNSFWMNCDENRSDEGDSGFLEHSGLDEDLGFPERLSPVGSSVFDEGPTLDYDLQNELLFNDILAGSDSDELIVSDYDDPRGPLGNLLTDDERDADNDDHIHLDNGGLHPDTQDHVYTNGHANTSGEYETNYQSLLPDNYNLNNDGHPSARIETNDPLDGSTMGYSRENLRPILDSKSAHLKPQQVTFDETARRSHGSSMAFASPAPESSAVCQRLDDEYIRAKKQHLKKLKKVGGMAKKGGSSAKRKGSRVKLSVARRILSKFKPGQILRVDRMLVQLLRSEEICLDSHYNEELAGNLFITSRWREYNVVLRRADNLLELLDLQFYNPKKGANFDEKPEHKLSLSLGTKIGFYSTNDKTISITVPREWGSRVAIMNARYESLAYQWLFVVKEILNEDEASVFHVKLPGLGHGIRIPVNKSLMKILWQTRNTLEMSKLDFGYHVQPGVLPHHFRDKVYRKLNHAGRFNDDVKKWLAENPEPWFCFKFYDRLEWVPPNSKIFYIMHKLMYPKYELLLQQVSRPPIAIEDKKGTTWNRPYPVEGFLGRATNTAGKEYSKLRPFYKIGYFFTVEHMLFFTKLFEGKPPSPTNDDKFAFEDEVEDNPTLPSFFIKDPFEVNKHGHIPWLQLLDFGARDNHIVGEFERRISQIAKASGVVDLLKVHSVGPCPHEEVNSRQLYFHAFLWHGVPDDLDSDEFLNCIIQIELENGSKLKLMAHNQTIRDEWIARLRDIVHFYKLIDSRRVAKASAVREANMKKLGMSEYMDSNFTNENLGFENEFALANDAIFDTNGLSMSKCIIMSGYLFLKHKKHANFGSLFVVLCPGYLIMFSLARRSKTTGMVKRRPCYEHYFTIPVSECFVYLGNQTAFDLIEYDNDNKEKSSGRNQLPRIYPDGWKLCEEELQLCFTLWFGQKRKLRHQLDVATNPGLISMVRRLGLTGKSMVFMARSRQMREAWVSRLLLEINRFSGPAVI